MSLSHRKDNRSIETFAHNIKDFSEREALWAIVIQKDWQERGRMSAVEDYGVDGSGKLIKGKLPNHNVDKKFILKDGTEILVEIKTCPKNHNKFFTFKVTSLKQIEEQGAIMVVPRDNGYFLFENSAMVSLLALPHKIYRGFSSNDFAVRIEMREVWNLVDNGEARFYNWKSEAQRIVDRNEFVLFRRKKL